MKSIFNKKYNSVKKAPIVILIMERTKKSRTERGLYLQPQNIQTIQENISRRKGVGNIRLVNELSQKLNQMKPNSSVYEEIKNQLDAELFRIPNKTHPDIFQYGEQPQQLKLINDMKQFTFQPKEFHEITKKLNLVRTEQLGNVCGNRSYYVLGELVELEHALLNYFLKKLLQNGFELISVPDILPREVIESCGMNTRGERNQVYTIDSKLHEPDLCLSGTSEMALAYFLAGKTLIEEDLPKKLAAVSRCYRAETSSTAEEKVSSEPPNHKNSNNFLYQLDALLYSIYRNGDTYVICGDINVDFLVNSDE